jgi:hypothetical protein
MLWALVSSAYVIYLLRKLKAEAVPQSVPSGPPAADLHAELDALNQRLAALELQLTGPKGQETIR